MIKKYKSSEILRVTEKLSLCVKLTVMEIMSAKQFAQIMSIETYGFPTRRIVKMENGRRSRTELER